MHAARLRQYPHETKGKNNMPKVGNKKFAYNAKGMAAAKKAEKKAAMDKKKKNK